MSISKSVPVLKDEVNRPVSPVSTSALTPPAANQPKRSSSPILLQRDKNHASKHVAIASVAAAAGAALVGLGAWAISRFLRRGPDKCSVGPGGKGTAVKGPCSGLKATSRCVALSDGSACVVRRSIPADNSCLFNAVGYAMHHSKSKASFLRSVVAREVSSDPKEYSDVFLGMPNAAYCSWIMNRTNWGGGIELSILAKHYGREISAWNIETSKGLVFGEEAGYAKQVMVIYNGIHYDSLAISPGPRASESEDTTEFNPRTARGKKILAAAQKLVELTHKGSKFVSNSVGASTRTKCSDCQSVFSSQSEVSDHAKKTGHKNYEQLKKQMIE